MKLFLELISTLIPELIYKAQESCQQKKGGTQWVSIFPGWIS